jgi:hypothetical protein
MGRTFTQRHFQTCHENGALPAPRMGVTAPAATNNDVTHSYPLHSRCSLQLLPLFASTARQVPSRAALSQDLSALVLSSNPPLYQPPQVSMVCHVTLEHLGSDPSQPQLPGPPDHHHRSRADWPPHSSVGGALPPSRVAEPSASPAACSHPLDGRPPLVHPEAACRGSRRGARGRLLLLLWFCCCPAQAYSATHYWGVGGSPPAASHAPTAAPQHYTGGCSHRKQWPYPQKSQRPHITRSSVAKTAASRHPTLSPQLAATSAVALTHASAPQLSRHLACTPEAQR